MIFASRFELSRYLTTRQCPIAKGWMSNLSISLPLSLEAVDLGEALTEAAADDVAVETEDNLLSPPRFFVDAGITNAGLGTTSATFSTTGSWAVKLDLRRGRFDGGGSGDGALAGAAAADGKLLDESRDLRFISRLEVSCGRLVIPPRTRTDLDDFVACFVWPNWSSPWRVVVAMSPSGQDTNPTYRGPQHGKASVAAERRRRAGCSAAAASRSSTKTARRLDLDLEGPTSI